jgi:hypothetical protein
MSNFNTNLLRAIVDAGGDGLYLVLAVDDIKRVPGAIHYDLRMVYSDALDRRAKGPTVALYIDGDEARARARKLAADNRRAYGVMRLEVVMELSTPPIIETTVTGGYNHA